MVGRVLLMHFVMKCAMLSVVVSCACLNYVSSIFPSLPCELCSNRPSIEVADV